MLNLSLNTLGRRLGLMLIGLFVSVMAVLAFSTYQSGLLWQDRASQQLYRGTVGFLLQRDHRFIDREHWRPNSLIDFKKAFLELVQKDLPLDIYYTDSHGTILQQALDSQSLSAETEHANISEINLKTLNNYFSSNVDLPLYLDDARSQISEKIFSAAKLDNGYLVVVLGPERYKNWLDKILHHNCLRLLSKMAIATGFVVILVGALLYGFIARPLKRLSCNIQHYQASGASDYHLLKPSKGSFGSEFNGLERALYQMAMRINRQVSQLQRLDQLRKEQLIHLSHDLKTPIAGAMGSIETVQLNREQLTPEQHQRFLKKAFNSCELLQDRVEDILQLAKLDNASAPCHKERFDLAALCQDSLSQHSTLAVKNHVCIEYRGPEEACWVDADINQIQRVISNLLTNAIRYCPNDFNGRVLLELTLEQGQYQIHINDNGKGIEQNELALIFEPYYRSRKQATAPAHSHQGLGLAICRRIIELHQSQLSVSSKPGMGTRFYFALGTA